MDREIPGIDRELRIDPIEGHVEMYAPILESVPSTLFPFYNGDDDTGQSTTVRSFDPVTMEKKFAGDEFNCSAELFRSVSNFSHFYVREYRILSVDFNCSDEVNPITSAAIDVRSIITETFFSIE